MSGPFTGIEVGGAFKVVLKQTGDHKVMIEADQDVIEMVRTEVKGDVLHIDMKHDWSWDNHGDIFVYIDFNRLDLLNVSGAADIKADGSIKADDLEIRVSGAGDMNLDVNAELLDVTVSGAGEVKISGSTEKQTIKLSGAGHYRAQDLKSQYTKAKATGAGSVVVHASDELDAYASGAGSVKYYGDPKKTTINSSGAGNVRSK